MRRNPKKLDFDTERDHWRRKGFRIVGYWRWPSVVFDALEKRFGPHVSIAFRWAHHRRRQGTEVYGIVIRAIAQ